MTKLTITEPVELVGKEVKPLTTFTLWKAGESGYFFSVDGSDKHIFNSRRFDTKDEAKWAIDYLMNLSVTARKFVDKTFEVTEID